MVEAQCVAVLWFLNGLRLHLSKTTDNKELAMSMLFAEQRNTTVLQLDLRMSPVGGHRGQNQEERKDLDSVTGQRKWS